MSQPRKHPAAGTVIAGKYRVERQLGEGGMAVVLEATHLVLGQRVAVKVLQGEGAQAPEVMERFRREAQIAAQLPGDHVARVSDVGLTEKGEPFLVMELLVGRDLEAEMRVVGQLPIPVAVDYILQASEGISEAHAAGLVHRDLKPGNLFVTKRRDGSPVIKVLDFGISKAAPGGTDVNLTKTTSNFGTPLYMSPEQIQSAKHVDARCDQHALGAILYFLLTGRPPFEAETLTALAVVIAMQIPQPVTVLRPDVPPTLDAVILRALAKRPQDRFPELASFAAALAPFGGSGAHASVRAITHALAYPDPSTDPSSRISLGNVPGARASMADADNADTNRVPGPGPIAAQTHAAISTAIRAGAVGPGRKAVVLAAIGATVFGVVALAMVASSGRPSDAGDTNAAEGTVAPAGTAPSAAAPTPSASAETHVEPAGPVPTASASTAPAATVAPTASAKSGRPTSKGSGGKPKPTNTVKDPTEVFGARRK